jgi:CRISPR/Cas system endoribonuclease Cas6 (RAMP superfamily)
VPLSTPLVRLKLTPDGSEPETLREGAGEPVARTLKDPNTPRRNMVVSSLAKLGARRFGVVVVVVVGGVAVVVVVVVGGAVVVVVVVVVVGGAVVVVVGGGGAVVVVLAADDATALQSAALWVAFGGTSPPASST